MFEETVNSAVEAHTIPLPLKKLSGQEHRKGSEKAVLIAL